MSIDTVGYRKCYDQSGDHEINTIEIYRSSPISWLMFTYTNGLIPFTIGMHR